MRDLFNNKKNIFLFIGMILCVGGIVTILLFYEVDERPEAISFSRLHEKEIVRWMEKNNVENYEIKYEYSDDIAEGNVIYQSIKEGEKFDSIVITISKGKEDSKKETEGETQELIELPTIDENTTRDSLEKFFEDNGFTDVTYEYTISELEKDRVVKLNVSGKAKKDDVIVVTLSAGKDTDSIVVTVPDFSKYSLLEAQSWAKTNLITLKYETELSETIERGKIISQSIQKDKEIKPGDTISLVISDGKGVKIPDFSGKNKEEITNWVKENKMENVKYLLVNSDTIEKDYFIDSKPKKDVEVSVDYPIYITLSLGKKTIVTVESGYEGKTAEELTAYVVSLNESIKVVDSGYTFYSDTIPSGKVHSYDTGDIAERGTVRYNLSLGPYTPNASEYEGKNINDASALAKTYNNKKAGVELKLNPEGTTDSSKYNITYGCSVSGKTVTCKYGVKSIPPINPLDYNELSETDARSKMTNYRNSYGQGSISIKYGTYGSPVDKTYGCTVTNNNEVSCKLYREELKAENFTNIAKEDANAKMNAYRQKYGVGIFIASNIDTDDYPAGKTFACTINDNGSDSVSVNCNVAVAIQKASIMEPSAYAGFFTSSYEGTKAALQPMFSSFTNVTFEAVESDKPVGQIVHIIVNGVTDSYTGGDYALNTPIKIQICNKQKS